MRNTLQDARELLTLETSQLLAYITEVAAPITTDEGDKEALEIVTEWAEVDAALVDRVVELIVALGEAPVRPPLGLQVSYYNFARAETLTRELGTVAPADLPLLEEMQNDYEGSEDLPERQLLHLIDDFIAQRKTVLAGVEKLIHGIEATQTPTESDDSDTPAPAAATSEESTATEEFPWHDEDIELEDRMKLADKGGLFEKLFAAMAQTDCTACGYDCEGYARAIADGEEDDLSLCSPGGDETLEAIQDLKA